MIALASCGVTGNDTGPRPARTPLAGIETAQAWNLYKDPSEGRAIFVDFSSAGAFYSERAPGSDELPDFAVADFGAHPNDDIDDTIAIQKTIDAAEAAGGGIVAFADGVYRIDDVATLGGLRIGRSNVVLRGSSTGQTRLTVTREMPPKDFDKLWSGPAIVRFIPEGVQTLSSNDQAASTNTQPILNDTPSGAYQLKLANANAFAPGDYIKLTMQSVDANDRFLNGKSARAIWTRLIEGGATYVEYHEVERVNGNSVVLVRPTLTEIDSELPWQVRRVDLIENVGFERICVDGGFTEPFEHHKNPRHDSGFRAVELNQTAHSWVSDNCFKDVTTAVSVRGGLANSVLLNTIEGNGGHFSFHAEFATRTLFGLNLDVTRNGQFHGPGASHMSVGTVVWRYLGPRARGFDAHALFPRHTLLDLVEMAGLTSSGGHFRNHPNHGEGLVLWNYHQTGDLQTTFAKPDILDFWDIPADDARTYWFTTAVDPVIVGYKGPYDQVNERHMRWVESMATHVLPNSLFEAQLAHRLGKSPEWITAARDRWQKRLASYEGQLTVEHTPRDMAR